MNKVRGVTLIELLISIAILAILLMILVAGFSLLNRKQALNSSADIVLASLNEARQLTLFSKEDDVYGVHLEEDKVVIFRGDSYVLGDDSNKELSINRATSITNVSVNGGGDSILFERLTGETGNYGSITLSQKSDSSKTITIKVNPSGLSYIQ